MKSCPKLLKLNPDAGTYKAYINIKHIYHIDYFFCLVDNCKEAWRNIKIAFTRSLKRKSGGAAEEKYYLFDKLQFIFPYVNVHKNTLQENLPLPPRTEEDEQAVDELASLNTEIGKNDNILKNTSADIQNAEPQSSTSAPSVPAVPAKKRKPVDPVDEYLMDFINMKKAAPKAARNPRKLFLLNLQFDVDEITGSQFRVFK